MQHMIECSNCSTALVSRRRKPIQTAIESRSDGPLKRALLRLIRKTSRLMPGLTCRPIHGVDWTMDTAVILKPKSQHPALAMFMHEVKRRSVETAAKWARPVTLIEDARTGKALLRDPGDMLYESGPEFSARKMPHDHKSGNLPRKGLGYRGVAWRLRMDSAR